LKAYEKSPNILKKILKANKIILYGLTMKATKTEKIFRKNLLKNNRKKNHLKKK